MMYLEKNGAGTCSSCSNQASYTITIGVMTFDLCSECSDYFVNRLQVLSGFEDSSSADNKTYKRDVYKSNFKVWSSKDVDFLKTTEFTPAEISEKLGRTVAAVRKKLRDLEIKPNRR
ncbi:MAG: hypothetical protein ACRDAS_00935 [Cetobacterium sp.]